MLYACKCIQTLIKGRGGTGDHDEGAHDILVKRSGILALKSCTMDDMLEIRKSSLETLAYLSRTRMDV
jgi:hypothetical protein